MRISYGRVLAGAMLIVPLAMAMPQGASAQAQSIRICDQSYALGDQRGIDVAVRECLGPNARLVIRQNGARGTVSVQGDFAQMPVISIGRPPKPNLHHKQ